MFERYSDRARRVVVLAQEEARRLNHNYIGTEHLLLALIHEGEGVAAKALGSLGITLEAARQQVEQIVGRGQEGPGKHIPFTPRGKKVLELSLREAIQLGHIYVGTEHILLGLIRDGDGVAMQVLADLAVDPNQARQRVIQVLHGHQGREPGPAGRGRRKLRSELLDRLTSVETRLSAVERRVGTTAPDLRDLEGEIAQVRREKEAAIDAQDFESAATLRDQEQRLLDDRSARHREWAASYTDLPSLTDEVQRLRDLLRRHGIDPEDGAA
jgi:ATP-dependent Clp protease ATP-binding subunit ClpA